MKHTSVDTKRYAVWYEQRRHGTLVVHTQQTIGRERLQSFDTPEYLLRFPVLGLTYLLLLRSKYLFTLLQSVTHSTWLICDAPLSRSAQCSFARLQKLRQNHRFCACVSRIPIQYGNPVRFSCRPNSYLVECEQSLNIPGLFNPQTWQNLIYGIVNSCMLIDQKVVLYLFSFFAWKQKGWMKNRIICGFWPCY